MLRPRSHRSTARENHVSHHQLSRLARSLGSPSGHAVCVLRSTDLQEEMTMNRTVIEHIASALDALTRCPVGHEWHDRHHARLTEIEKNYLPSGSGIDCGTKIDRDRSTASRIVFTTEFHHMDENGMYDGWTEHTLTARPSFVGRIAWTITGRDRNGIMDYLADVFDTALRETVED